jgi:hypothetical protein
MIPFEMSSFCCELKRLLDVKNKPRNSPLTFFYGPPGASIATSLVVKILDRHHEALFVGQWAPTILILGLYNKLVKQHGSDQFHA